MSRPVNLTEDELQRATAMRAAGMAIHRIAAALDLPDHRVRKALDPTYRDRTRAERARQEYKNNSRILAGLSPGEVPPRRDVERLLRQIPPDTRGLTARIAGDPLPGRSALDRSGA